MRKIKNTLLITALATVFMPALAQDIHFSQYGMSPVNLNPAFTGFFDGEYRAGAIYRSQWRTVPVPYSTFSFMADMRRPVKKKQGDYTGIGFVFNNDVSGDSRYGTTQLYIPMSYIKRLKDSTLLVSVGIQPGISNIGFRTNKLTFDSQYDGDAYNPALSNGENFALQSRTYLDLNTGGAVQYLIKQRASLTAGVAFSHVNVPRVSYFKNDNIRLDMKTAAYFNFAYPVAPKIDLITEVLYERQGKFQETVLGEKIALILDPKERQSINAGIYLRARDAVIARVGYEHKAWTFGMSYDVNTSAFKAATNRKGAVEFAVIYVFRKEVLFIPKKRVCPVYM
ncbi:MAG: PorP/SprF family type IX secretion system membrane protein [Bacteroidia bacterium]